MPRAFAMCPRARRSSASSPSARTRERYSAASAGLSGARPCRMAKPDCAGGRRHGSAMAQGRLRARYCAGGPLAFCAEEHAVAWGAQTSTTSGASPERVHRWGALTLVVALTLFRSNPGQGDSDRGIRWPGKFARSQAFRGLWMFRTRRRIMLLGRIRAALAPMRFCNPVITTRLFPRQAR